MNYINFTTSDGETNITFSIPLEMGSPIYPRITPYLDRLGVHHAKIAFSGFSGIFEPFSEVVFWGLTPRMALAEYDCFIDIIFDPATPPVDVIAQYIDEFFNNGDDLLECLQLMKDSYIGTFNDFDEYAIEQIENGSINLGDLNLEDLDLDTLGRRLASNERYVVTPNNELVIFHRQN